MAWGLPCLGPRTLPGKSKCCGNQACQKIYDTYPLTFPLAEAKEHAALERLRKYARERDGNYDAPQVETADVAIQVSPPTPSPDDNGALAEKGGD